MQTNNVPSDDNTRDQECDSSNSRHSNGSDDNAGERCSAVSATAVAAAAAAVCGSKTKRKRRKRGRRPRDEEEPSSARGDDLQAQIAALMRGTCTKFCQGIFES